MDDQEWGYLWNKRSAELYRLQLDTLYHQKRERFFDASDRLAKAVSVIGGSAALAKIGGTDALQYLAAAITITSTFSLVFGLSERARRHADLARSFRLLEAELMTKGERDFSETDLNAWAAKRATLESSEPPSLGTLVILCQNELARAIGQPDKVVHLPWYKRLLANYLDFSSAA